MMMIFPDSLLIQVVEMEAKLEEYTKDFTANSDIFETKIQSSVGKALEKGFFLNSWK